MKFHILAVLMVTFIAGCTSKPLTEIECQALANKEVDFALSKAPPGEAEGLRAFLEKKADGIITSAWQEKPTIVAITAAWSRQTTRPVSESSLKI